MAVSVKVIEDSLSGHRGERLTTLEVRFPKIILPEVLTHRVFSRNTASSRAIPISKMIKSCRADMYVPKHWGANQSGMQAHKEVSNTRKHIAKVVWITAAYIAMAFTWLLSKLGLHKQVANRLLDPFVHVTMIITSSEWGNFLKLRNHEDAEPNIRNLAELIADALRSSEPKLLKEGEWHLPYVTEKQRREYSCDEQVVISTACCASVSYKTVDGKPMTLERAYRIYNKLIASCPAHASPCEHQATPDVGKFVGFTEDFFPANKWGNRYLHGNLRGWMQHRKMIGF